MNDSDGYWLAGLTDGEGCFALWTRRRRVGRSNDCRCVSFVFKIAMRADDRPVLERVRKILGGIGSVTHNRRHRNPSYNGRPSRGKPLAQFTIHNRRDLLVIVALFRRFRLRSKKRRDFELWAKALETFVARTAAVPRVWEAKTNARQVRPPKGTSRERFKKIPDRIYVEMQRFELGIKDGRRYIERRGAA